MTVSGFTFNAFSENTYLLHDTTGQCVVIDPGCYERAEQDALRTFIADNGLEVVLLLNTHCHIDHVFGNKFIVDTYQVPFLIHEADLSTLRAVPSYAPNYGFPRFEITEPTGFLTPGQPVHFGETEVEVRFVPGHAPGHVVFYHEPTQTVIGGDVLFKGSIGRTDLPGGDYDTLIESIRSQLLTLPDSVTIYPGHGPATTVGAERRSNPFLQ
ncbi:MBL fold metallo-hydrolase [Hymenobacter taeanensis]|uniref:MBL fold metallo-hydrolase n=1 Tax=Hymenobacter taeanensis TaxID=2735321 RepID=A0A6M6BJJ0_9BACT|nr:MULTISPECIES: MBL fold metallo-hydrolase [Hymenobacter]QJX47235.1 MBL fold metallo-hydrolase [Hymenobacter taeanensis]UOQ79428.1 MBL fold metallo-hydrolase [Hymenobacter sp. 5414T-23]